ncbi:oxidoreductase-like domain-containing protein [Amphritea balenae]|uniref:Oxidoreductase-like domain-containing protein n=1 Tax=Amphritea balenae TaxID=452629 RepID=A0A3P1SV31_9GAMM|nr:oxidoreductase-like domain-containing protein [Amphritea balenae]RRD01009.1 hypothetical protein EHS89_00105 [Amphritea balenae]GGK60777.1 hypothetical protein GCM10007941_08750 [Amphritea balenae]
MTLEKPTRPADFECCEGQCSPCVWDTYFEEMNAWNAAQKAAKAAEQAALDKPETNTESSTD